MMTVLLTLLALVVAGAVVFFLMKTGKIEDKDGNNIPDVIEEKVEDVKEVVKVVKERTKRVAEETKDVVEAAKKVVKQSKDVVNAAKSSGTRKGRKPSTKK
jgi:gas vesicle protein